MSDELDPLLVEIMANHFPGARTDGNRIDLGFAGLTIECQVHGVRPVGRYSSASLFFQLVGGALGDEPVFASISGYEETPERAVVIGACNWACSFGPVLRAGLAGEAQPEVARFEVDIHGQRFRIFVDGLDRVMSFGEADADLKRTQAARTRLGAAPWLCGVVAESGRLPLLPPDRPSVLSVFVGERPDGRIVEVKAHGVDWPAALDAIDGENEPAGAMTLLRELAVAVPLGPPSPLARDAITATLAGLAEPLEHGPRAAVDWRGWRAHRGELGAPLAQAAIERLEQETGPLPDDHRRFLLDVAGHGAGPGYGLIAPSAALAAGTFDWRDGEEPDAPPAGVLPLAHAGCGVVWLLVLRGASRGEVWLDASGSDRIARRVAGSFDAWYRMWLDAGVRDSGPWTQWDGGACATPHVFSQVLESIQTEGMSDPDEAVARLADRIGAGAICLTTTGSPYFPAGAVIDPCQSCTATAARVGVTDGAFQAGVAPFKTA